MIKDRPKISNKLDMEPHIYLMEIIIFSQYHVIVRPSNLLKDYKIHFSVLKICEFFLNLDYLGQLLLIHFF
jgi:hypothetical protein